jgi:hypothetical protein
MTTWPRDMRAETPGILLASEARGEFLLVERLRGQLERRGWQTRHATALSDDAPEIAAGTTDAVALDARAEFRRAVSLPSAALAARLDECQVELGLNLRRVWQADWRRWREGASDEQMARLALAHMDAWAAVIEESAPLACVWGEDGGHLVKRALFELAPRRGVPAWFLTPLPLPDRMLAISNPLNRLDRAAFEAVEPTAEERVYGEQLLADVRESRLQFAVPRDMAMSPARAARFAGLLAERYVKRSPGARSLHPFSFARSYVRQRAASAALRPLYRPIGAKPFVFHPIHFAHDVQITVRAPQWENQLALVEHVAASLPYGYELAVKEHPFDPGGAGFRALAALVRRRPEIRLLHPAIHAQVILPRCAAVSTINSTTGFEALFFGKPLITFGHSPYRGLGLTHDVADPFETPQVLFEALRAKPAAQEEVVRLIAFLARTSVAGRPLTNDLGDDNLAAYADAIAALAERSAAARSALEGSGAGSPAGAGG